MEGRDVYGRTARERDDHLASVYLGHKPIAEVVQKYADGDVGLDDAVKEITLLGSEFFGDDPILAKGVAVYLCYTLG